jgi:hypothetical protein
MCRIYSPTTTIYGFANDLFVLLSIFSDVDLKNHSHFVAQLLVQLLLFGENVAQGVRCDVRDTLDDTCLGGLFISLHLLLV